MAYSPPSGNVTGLTGIMQWVNSSVDQWLFPGIVTAVWFIIVIKLLYSTEDLGKSFAGASFACMIFTILLRITDLINTEFMVIFIILTAISAVWMHFENAKF